MDRHASSGGPGSPGGAAEDGDPAWGGGGDAEGSPGLRLHASRTGTLTGHRRPRRGGVSRGQF